MGHIDTVGVDDFGSIREYAFDPDKLPELLRQMDLGEEVQRIWTPESICSAGELWI